MKKKNLYTLAVFLTIGISLTLILTLNSKNNDASNEKSSSQVAPQEETKKDNNQTVEETNENTNDKNDGSDIVPVTIDYEKDQVYDATPEPPNADLSTLISSYHETLNQLLEYDKHLTFDWDKFKEINVKMTNDIQQILPSIETPYIKQDLESIEKLLSIGMKNRDINTMLYAHRILQDLDVEYNKRADSKFGFSIYDSGGENSSIVTKYLEDNKKLLDTN